MSRTTLDPVFAEAVSDQLATAGDKHSWFARRARKVRAGIAAASGLAVAALVTGGAIYVAGLPGEESTVQTWPETTLSASGIGPSMLYLGPAPDGATHIRATLTCGSEDETGLPDYDGVTSGDDFLLDDIGLADGDGEGASIDCTLSERGHLTSDISDFGPDGLVTIQAPVGASWSVTALYVRIIASDWGVNANGDTYGVPNSVGMPDLTAAQATNGKIGYIDNVELMCTAPDQTSIPVYEADGETVIGEFPISEGVTEEDIDTHVKPEFCP